MTGHPRFWILLAAGLLSVAIAVGCRLALEHFLPPRRRPQAPRRPGERRTGGIRTVRAGGQLAAAAARRSRRRQARRLDVGIGRRGLRRNARPHLDRAARRAAAAAGREAVDAVRHAHAVARQRHRQRRRPERDVRAGGEARMGAPLSPRHLRRRSRRQDGPVVAAISTRCSRASAAAGRTRSR